VLEVRPLPLGHSGFSYLVRAERAGLPRALVLRLPPPRARPLGPADVARQGRIIAALHAQGFPVPAVVAMSGEPVVDGRPFLLVEMVAGERVEEAEPRLGAERVTRAAVDALRRLHSIPIESTGLDEEPVGLEAEVERWRRLQERAGDDLGLPYERLRQRLLATSPGSLRAPCLVHADYHFGNQLYGPDGDVVAVLDWEIAELGQPLLDVACLAVGGLSRGAGPGGPVPGPAVAPERLAELYGADPQELLWFCALTCYKYAAVYVYNLLLSRRGKRPDPFNEGVEPMIARLLENGLGLLAA
jgi:aminoglycoside phosphotransferase (APT) family kinase protein